MSAAGDVTVVVGAVTVATGFTIVKDISQSKPRMQPVLGGMILGAFLLFIAMFSPEMAKAIAILVLISSALMNGGVVFKVAEKVAG
jgi:drug/metabolite transporter (DMT)-like permease